MHHSHITPPTSADFVHLKGRNLNNAIGTIATGLRTVQGTTVLERGTEVIGVIENGTASTRSRLFRAAVLRP
jgi:hypothetical protein